MSWPFGSSHQPTLSLGSWVPPPPIFHPQLRLDWNEINTHKHIIGLSGMGKSKLLEHIFLSLLHQGIGVTLVDPHGDSARACLGHLVGSGFFDQPGSLDKLVYVEFSDHHDYHPSFNVLNAPHVQSNALASNILDAFHRAWPSLREGAAPAFDNFVAAGCLVLIENGLPLPALHRLLTDKAFRDRLLQYTRDQEVISFFRNRYDRQGRVEAPAMIESTLRRIFALSFNPVLRYSLGQTDEVLDFRRFMDSGKAALISLGGIQDLDARKLLGCLITIGYEQAAFSRESILPEHRRPHHLLLDEFAQFVSKSEEALTRMLAETRKYGLFTCLVNQTFSQTSQKLLGALQNCSVRIVFRTGPDDVEVILKQLQAIDPTGEGITNQRGTWIKYLLELPPRHALVKVGGRKVVEIETPLVKSVHVDPDTLADVRQAYRNRLTRHKDAITLPYQDLGEDASLTTSRTVSLRD